MMAIMEGRPIRRSERKIASRFEAIVNDVPSHIIDASYHGLRLQMPAQRMSALPPNFNVRVPLIGVAVTVQRVWARSAPGQRHIVRRRPVGESPGNRTTVAWIRRHAARSRDLRDISSTTPYKDRAYSCRSAVSGSTLAARRAGTYDANPATAAKQRKHDRIRRDVVWASRQTAASRTTAARPATAPRLPPRRSPTSAARPSRPTM